MGCLLLQLKECAGSCPVIFAAFYAVGSYVAAKTAMIKALIPIALFEAFASLCFYVNAEIVNMGEGFNFIIYRFRIFDSN